MNKLNHFIAVTVQIICFVAQAQAARNTKAGINAKPYHILCDIYNVASNPPTSLYDTAEVDEIKGKIDIINASLADESWVNEISKAESHEKLPEAFKAQNGGFEKLWKNWKKAADKLSQNYHGIKKLPAANPIVKLAQKRLAKIEIQAEKIISNLKKISDSAELETIKGKFDDAIGEKGCEGNAANCGITGNRGANSCGTAAGVRGDGSGATKSGTNLIVDFFCLCAARQDTDANKAAGTECIDTQLSASSHSWGGSPPTLRGAKELWEKLKGGCKALPHGEPASVATAHRGLANFLAELAKVETATDNTVGNKQFGIGVLGVVALGSGAASGACDGDMTSDNKGICVAYGATPGAWESIDWLQNMKSGIDLLKKAENKTFAIQEGITRLKMLQDRAEEIYEEATAALELENAKSTNPTQDPTQKQNPSTPADKSIAQDPNAASTATTTRFILPWTLLI